jgi:predicted transposase YbfD/YdcC
MDSSVNFKSIFGQIQDHRSHINKLHWTLDVAFSEDASRKRAGNAAQNYSFLLKIALNLLKNETSKKPSMKSKRLEAGWNETYLMKILNIKV